MTTSAQGFDNVGVLALAPLPQADGSVLGIYAANGFDPVAVNTIGALGLAVTTNGGVDWRRVTGSRTYGSIEWGALENGDNNEWDDYQILGPAIEQVGPVYRLWATGLGTPASYETWRIGRYSTMDPTRFGPHIENYTCCATAVVADDDVSGDFDEIGTEYPSVVIGPDGIKRVYYTGISASGRLRIGLAEFQP